MDNFFKKGKVIYLVAAVLSALLLCALIKSGAETSLTVFTACVLAVLIACIRMMDHMRNRYENELLAQLSEMMDNLIAMRTELVVSDSNESLLSKMQMQAIRLTEILKNQRERAVNERDELTSLISDISHQIKTPVATIRMYKDLINEPETTEAERREYLDIISESIEKLTFLMESMIKLSRLETGIISMNPKPVDIERIVSDAISQALPKAELRNIKIVFTDLEPETLTVKADMKWTVEALFNVIDNAVKYSAAESIVNVTCIKYPSFGCIMVSDCGPGIAESEMPKIFRRFYRGNVAKDSEGTGIGLFLCRKIITEQGGYIKASSDKGAAFQVFLPCIQPG